MRIDTDNILALSDIYRVMMYMTGQNGLNGQDERRVSPMNSYGFGNIYKFWEKKRKQTIH